MKSLSQCSFGTLLGPFLSLVACGMASASPPSPHPVIARQPDGTQIALRVRGDERFNWQEDLNGFTVVQRSDRMYVYAREAAELESTEAATSDLVVGKVDPAALNLTKRILPPPGRLDELRSRRVRDDEEVKESVRVAPAGTVKNLVILMRFSDHAGRQLPAEADIDKLFNAVGGDPALAPTGSVRDYYKEVSYGRLDLASTVVAWVNLPNTEAFYANGNSGGGPRMKQAIRDALVAADGLVNFNDFDRDHDGWVDAIAFLHSGYGAEWGGDDADGTPFTSRIWSHRWAIPAWTSAEGVRVSDYHISPALWGTSGAQIGRIGVICHETGHFLGLPDLYSPPGEGEGLGSWCLMSNSWGFDGSQLYPPHMSTWCKMQLNWVAPQELSPGASVVTLAAAEKSPQAGRISAGYPAGEYLLIENRQPLGFDRGIPAGTGGRGGLVVYHVDELKPGNDEAGFPGQSGWPQNNRHYKIAVLQADGKFDIEKGTNRGDANDPFRPGHVTRIDATTVPNMNAYQNGTVVTMPHVLSDLTQSGSDVSLKFTQQGAGGGAGDGGGAGSQAEWTFMVFMNGDNNLEPFALQDFAEMAAVGSTAKVNLVVQFDRTPGHTSDAGDWHQTLRFLVKKDTPPIPANAVEDLGEVNMGDGRVLSEFVDWAQQKYPAKRYALVIWDHGQGWRVRQAVNIARGPVDSADEASGSNRANQLKYRESLKSSARLEIGQPAELRGIEADLVTEGPVRYVSSDDTSGDHLFNREIQDHLTVSLNGEKLDLIGFDACLMAMLETAYALREVGDVMVASQELEPGEGWNYTRILKELTTNPGLNAEGLGKAIVDAYQKEYSMSDPTTTLSAIRLGKVRMLAADVTRFADQLRVRLPAEATVIRKARDECAVFAPGYGLHGVDLQRYCERIAARSTNSNLKTLAGRVKSRLQSAVIANYAGSGRLGNYGSAGLAIYFPQSRTQFDYDPDREGYLESNSNWPVQFVQQHTWDNFLKSYFTLNP